MWKVRWRWYFICFRGLTKELFCRIKVDLEHLMPLHKKISLRKGSRPRGTCKRVKSQVLMTNGTFVGNSRWTWMTIPLEHSKQLCGSIFWDRGWSAWSLHGRHEGCELMMVVVKDLETIPKGGLFVDVGRMQDFDAALTLFQVPPVTNSSSNWLIL